MTIDAFLDDLRRREIVVSVEGDKLRCTAPKGVLTREIQQQLAARKAEILALLSGRAEGPALVPVPRDGRLPLSYGQERLWFLHQLEPQSAAHNIFATIGFSGAPDVPALAQALAALVARQEALRTVFPAVDGQPSALVRPAGPVDLPLVDLRTLTPLEREDAVSRLTRELAGEPFDLQRGPLVRFTVVRATETEWALLVAQHHIVTDRWSLGLLLHEIRAHYDATRAGQPPALPPLTVQYADYAAWQRASEPHLAPQLRFWRERLAGPLPVLELAGDRPRPIDQTYAGAWETRLMPEALRTRLLAVSQAEGATLFMTLLAGYVALLARHTGLDDVIVGSPVAGRSRPELEPLIGYFINTLVLRTDLSGDPSLRTLVGRVRDVVLDAFANQDVPFERLLPELRVPRDLSRPPVFQTVFVMQTAPKQVEVKAEMTFTASGGTMFDLSLTAVEVADGLRVTAEYDTDLFDAATIARLLAQYEAVLTTMALRPDTPLSGVSILAADDVALLRRISRGPDVEGLADGLVHALVHAQAARTPAGVAVRDRIGAITYAALAARGHQVAQRLRALGLGPGAQVGVCVDRTIDMVAALLGVLEAGAAYVPMDPLFPPDRLAYMAADAGLAAVLTDDASVESVPPLAVPVLRLDDPAAWVGVAADPVATAVTPEHPAYVIYTSGSTGQPKGVVVPHRAVTNFLRSMAERPGLDAGDVLLAVTTLSFDIAGLELFLPLTVGAHVVLASRDEASDGRALAERLQACGATVLQATPATWRLLLDAGWEPAPGLRMLCGGEPLPRALADRLTAGGGTLWNLYGPTETTIWSTIEEVAAGTGAVAIGRPIANTQTYVLDAAGRPVPVGVLGELYIGGAGVAHGYHGQPALTARQFVPDPYGGVEGARLYRTGDLARWRPDGRLECLGRVDQQVKVRGFRIELGEVEAALARHPAVREAVAAVQPDASGVARLVAYLVTDGTAPTASDLRRHVKASLPDYMVPSVFTTLDALPLTANRKVDRRALPPVFAAAPATERHVAPRTDAERAVIEIWQGLLGGGPVSVDANFFDVGGHSLLAMQVIARLEARFGVRLNPRVLILDTAEQIAARCEREGRAMTAAGTGGGPAALAAPGRPA